MTENDSAKLVVDLCFKMHKQYGPGLFESIYEEIFVMNEQRIASLLKGNKLAIDS